MQYRYLLPKTSRQAIEDDVVKIDGMHARFAFKRDPDESESRSQGSKRGLELDPVRRSRRGRRDEASVILLDADNARVVARRSTDPGAKEVHASERQLHRLADLHGVGPLEAVEFTHAEPAKWSVIADGFDDPEGDTRIGNIIDLPRGTPVERVLKAPVSK